MKFPFLESIRFCQLNVDIAQLSMYNFYKDITKPRYRKIQLDIERSDNV